MREPRWLLLAHQLPTRSSNARVRTWRRLQQLGAVPSRNSVYVLPNTEQCREDFEWLRTEKAFQESRTQDYKALQKDTNRLLTPARRKKGGGGGSRLTRALRALRDRLDALDRTDFFRAAAREGAAAALAELARKVEGERPPKPPARAPTRRADFQGRRWVTRRRPGVDRMASAWLIRRFIDPRATFAFVDKAAAADVPFDMYDTSHGFGHRGGLCTFEVLCEEFGIVDAPVRQVALIVHDLDLKEKTYAAPESVAIGRMIDGLRAMHADDATLLEQGIGMFEALARPFEA
jgi:hypothetical protein